ncbi:TPA: hypothetical protein ACH3X3_006574 [Trebouxia sp. C0006]
MQREQVRTSQIRLRLDLFGKLWLKVKTGSLRPYRAVVTPAVSDAVFAGATNRAAESRLAVHVALARQWERARQGMDKVPPPKRQVRQIKAGCLGFARPGHSVRRCTACKQRHRSRQTKVVQKRKRAKVTRSLPQPSRLLANLKEGDLEQFLLAVPIYCGSPEHRKHGLWRPMQKSVECMDQDCRGKPPHERLMKYSGHASFEAHCGKNPKQQHWRNSFKVDVEGFRGQSVEKFMAAHGISLDSRLPTAVAAAAPTAQQSSSPPPPSPPPPPPPHGGAPPPSPPLSLSPVSLPAASLQHPHQYQQDTHSIRELNRF